mmetsp:Transcript_26385/g.86560  ORF Transcript_26385/g.86560 Transcript_26385/m.86560 type:complete len:268 (+) Transcript_26385:450-1253(+)
MSVCTAGRKERVSPSPSEPIVNLFGRRLLDEVERALPRVLAAGPRRQRLERDASLLESLGVLLRPAHDVNLALRPRLNPGSDDLPHQPERVRCVQHKQLVKCLCVLVRGDVDKLLDKDADVVGEHVKVESADVDDPHRLVHHPARPFAAQLLLPLHRLHHLRPQQEQLLRLEPPRDAVHVGVLEPLAHQRVALRVRAKHARGPQRVEVLRARERGEPHRVHVVVQSPLQNALQTFAQRVQAAVAALLHLLRSSQRADQQRLARAGHK